MTDPQSTPELRYCKHGDTCLHPDGPWLPATDAYFPPRPYGLDCLCRPCKRAYHNRYRAEHRTRIREQDRASKLRTREHRSIQARAYYRRNRAARLEAARLYRDTHRELLCAKSREHGRWYRRERPALYRATRRRYRLANPDKIIRWRRGHYTRHPEKYYEWSAARRARLKGAPGAHTRRDIEAQYRAQDGRCWWCGKAVGEAYHVDHRIPLAKGGSNNPDNLCIACPDCNCRKGARLPWEFSGRLL